MFSPLRAVKAVPTPAVIVPKVGVTKVGDVANTATPVPVSSDNAAKSPAELSSSASYKASSSAAVSWVAAKPKSKRVTSVKSIESSSMVSSWICSPSKDVKPAPPPENSVAVIVPVLGL